VTILTVELRWGR